MRLLDIAQHMWRTGEIPQELGWTFLFLVPRVTADTRVIELLETLWEVVEALIDTCLRSSLQFHDFLHRFRTGRGTGTAIMELKLAQDISRVDHEPLFVVFLDLRKAYNTMDRDRLIQTLKRYGVGPRMCGLLETF